MSPTDQTYRAKVVVATLLALVLLGAGVFAFATGPARAGSSATPSASPTTFGTGAQPFASSSPFNMKVKTTPKVDAKSAAIVKNLVSSGVHANLVQYSVPIYTATASTPLRTVTCTETWTVCPFAGKKVPLSRSYTPSAGSDGAMVVVDGTSGKVYEFWRATRAGANWSTAWGSISTLSGSGWAGMATGSGASRLGGVIRLSELAAGVIPHALVIQTSQACKGSMRSPATKTDGTSTASACIPEGARVQLDPSIDLAALHLPKAELTIATALQKYGAYVIDKGSARLGMSFERAPGASGINPGAAYAALGLAHDYALLDGIPWSKLRVLAGWNS